MTRRRAGTRPPVAALLLVLPVIALLVIAAGLVGGLRAATGSPAAAMVRRVVIVAVPDLQAEDIGAATPALAALARTGATGLLSVKDPDAATDTGGGFATLGAGNRAGAVTGGRDLAAFPDLHGPAAGPLQLTGMAALEALAARRADRAVPGALARAVQASGGCVTGVGEDPHLLVAVAAPGGRVDRWLAPGTTDPGRCALTIVDAGQLLSAAPGARGRARALRAVDAEAAGWLHAAGPGTVTLVAGISDVGPDAVARADRAHLHPLLAAGIGRGALRTATTRRAPYVQLLDLGPSALHWLGLAEPASMVGQPLQVVAGTPPTPAHLADLDRRARAAYRLPYPTAVPFVGLILALTGWVAGRRRGPQGRRDRQPAGPSRWAAGAALVLAGALPGSFLAGLLPWWHLPPGLRTAAYAALSLAFGAALAVAADRLGGIRSASPLGPATAAAGLSVAVLGGDLLSGAHLQIDTLFGYSPLVAGRFAGIGNLAFGLFAAALLLGAAGIAARRPPGRRRLVPVAIAGALGLVAAGSPQFGSKVGAVLTLVPAVGALLLLAAGARPGLRRILLAGAAAAVVLAAVLAAATAVDLARPAAQRTHLGRFASDLLHGGGSAGGSGLLARKLHADLALALHGPLQALVLALLVWGGIGLARVVPGRGVLGRLAGAEPTWLAGLRATAVAAAVGLFANDSGIAVVACCLLVAVPLTVAVLAGLPATPDGPPRPDPAPAVG